MGYPGGCSSKTLIDTIKSLIDALTTSLATVDTNVDTLIATTHTVEEHLHSAGKIAPDLAAGITVTATTGGGTWTLGAASATILTTSALCDIHYLHLTEISANGNYQLNLYDDDNLICAVPFAKAAVTSDNYARIPIMTPLIAIGSVITAKMASSTDDGETCKIKVFYHEYP